MSNANASAPAPSVSVGSALLVCNDAGTIKQLSASMQQLAMFPEVCVEVGAALGLLNRRKFEAVIVDLQFGDQAKLVLEKVRLSPSNRTAVIFAISDSDAETAGAFKDGSNLVLRRPLSPALIDRSLKVAYGLIVRERRRYFRCPVEIPVHISIARSTRELVATSVNISERGMALATAVPLRVGEKLQMRMVLPGTNQSATLTEAAV